MRNKADAIIVRFLIAIILIITFVLMLGAIGTVYVAIRDAVNYLLDTYGKVVIDAEGHKLIDRNSKAFEDSIMENVIEDGIYNFNELTPFEWDTVYFIKPYIKDNMNVSVRNIYERTGCYWENVYNIGDPSSVNEQAHIVFKKDDEVIAYRANMPFTKPFYMYLYKWSDGEFKSAENPAFEITIEEYGDIDDEMSNRGICLKTKEQSLP